MSSNTSQVPFSSWPFLSLMGSSRLSSWQSNEWQLHMLLLHQAPKTPSHVMSHSLSYFPFGWRLTKGEIWFPVCLPQPMNTHWNFEWERDLHWTDLFYILGLFFFKAGAVALINISILWEASPPLLLRLFFLEQHSNVSKAMSYENILPAY